MSDGYRSVLSMVADELQKITEGLYVYSIGAFVGKNASGKTTALELLDCCYDILGKFSLENKHYSYEGIKLEIIFFHEEYIYKYTTELKADLATDKDELKASILNDWRYRDFYIRYQEYVERWRP